MISLIQQYPLASVFVAFFIGGTLGFFAACLCAVSAHADRGIEIQ